MSRIHYRLDHNFCFEYHVYLVPDQVKGERGPPVSATKTYAGIREDAGTIGKRASPKRANPKRANPKRANPKRNI